MAKIVIYLGDINSEREGYSSSILVGIRAASFESCSHGFPSNLTTPALRKLVQVT
jgi:hypothetical protein